MREMSSIGMQWLGAAPKHFLTQRRLYPCKPNKPWRPHQVLTGACCMPKHRILQHLVGGRVVDHVAGRAVGGRVLDGLRARQVAHRHLNAARLAQHAPRAARRAGQLPQRHLRTAGNSLQCCP